MTQNENLELKTKGYTILRNKITTDWLDKLSIAIDKSFGEHRKIQLENKNFKLPQTFTPLDFMNFLRKMFIIIFF